MAENLAMKYKHIVSLIAFLFLYSSCSDSNQKVDTAELFRIANGKPIFISLLANRGEYVCCELAEPKLGEGVLIANRETKGGWETFELVDLKNGNIALKAANNKFVCADAMNRDLLCANRDLAGDWETFNVVSLPEGKVALKTLSGKYVSVAYDLTDTLARRLIANRTEIGDWEKFAIEIGD